MVFATFALARLDLHALPSLAAAAATTATPFFIVHARIFKEDIFVAAFLRDADQIAARAGAASRHPARSAHWVRGRIEIHRRVDPAFCHSGHRPRPGAGTGAAAAPCGNRQCRLHRHFSSHHAAGDQTSEPLATRCRLRASAFDRRSRRAAAAAGHLGPVPSSRKPVARPRHAPFCSWPRRPCGAVCRRAGAAHAAHTNRECCCRPSTRRPRSSRFPIFRRYMWPLVPLLLILGASFSTSSRRGGITAVSSRPLSWP
jgi:hypothetical protein